MTKWHIYFLLADTFMRVDEFYGSQLELLEQLKKYNYIMEVRRAYDQKR
jgi:hypothetical protein